MPRRRLRDLVVVLPGITGSVLSRRGKPIWAPSHRLAGVAATLPARAAKRLELAALTDDLDGPEVVATGLMPDAHMIAGLVKIEGYSRLLAAIRNNFEVVEARDASPGNLIEFPYDWRLDNRITAQRLADVVGPALASWRRFADIPDARVVFIAHSMGGLIARYFLEVLEGWSTCRALITFGTPFRGSPQALGYLANGYKRLHLDLSAAMRSFPSVYQLLPIYPMVSLGGTFRRVAEVSGIPNLDVDRAVDALRFHREIEDAIAANDAVRSDRYAVLPVVGTHQPTFQSADFDGQRVTLRHTLPHGVDPFFGAGDLDGDGTVPVASAAPVDLSNVYTDVYHPERHSSLHVGPTVLGDLVGKLAKMQSQHLAKLRGPDPESASSQPAITLELDDAYGFEEDVVVAVRWSGLDRVGVEMAAEVTALGGGASWTRVMKPTDEGWTLTVPDLPAGFYRVAVTATGRGTYGAPSVHDVFEIVAPPATAGPP